MTATVVAVVISYCPEVEALQSNLELIGRQTDAVIVIDNGSPEETVNRLSRMRSDVLDVVPLGYNAGIAKAQNLGIAAARERGASHVVLFDQDSRPAAGMVQCLLRALTSADRLGGRVALAAPNYVDDRHSERIPFFRVIDDLPQWFGCQSERDVFDIDAAISSGALISIAALDEVGGMGEDLFIDMVDIEWCFRAKSLGFRFLGVCGAFLSHCLGEEPLIIAGRQVAVHSPLRNYYFFRNVVWMFRQDYVPRVWKRVLARQMIKRYLLFSTCVAPRLSYFKEMTRGVWHGLRGRLGER